MHTDDTPLEPVYDVVVVGARCAGAATAMLLARAGLSVLAVERSAPGADTLSTHALTRPGVLQLSRWGVLDAVRAAGTPRIDTVVQCYGDEVVEIPIAPKGDVDGLYAPRRSLLDGLLVDAARAAGATVRHGTAVTDLIHDRDGRVGGVVVGRPGAEHHVRCRLVVGADGARSPVARWAGATYERRAAASTAIAYTYLPGLPDHAYRNHFADGLAVGVIPTDDGEANVWVSVPMGRLPTHRRAVAELYRSALDRVDPGLARLAAVADLPIRRFPGLLGFSRTPWGPGWVLVGDAVYFKDPVSAHGMTDALIGAELVARAVVTAFVDGDETAALEDYAVTRRRLARPMIDPIDRLAGFDWSPADVEQEHRRLNHAMRAEWEYLSALAPLPTPSRR